MWLDLPLLLLAQGKLQLLPPAPPYYPCPSGKIHNRVNIWSFTVGWHECCDPAGGVGALCNFPCSHKLELVEKLLEKEQLGVFHGSELVMVFDAQEFLLNLTEHKLAAQFGSFWTTFAATGPAPLSPNTPKAVCDLSCTSRYCRFMIGHSLGRMDVFYFLATFPFIWGSPAPQVCSSIQIPICPRLCPIMNLQYDRSHNILGMLLKLMKLFELLKDKTYILIWMVDRHADLACQAQPRRGGLDAVCIGWGTPRLFSPLFPFSCHISVYMR